MLMAAQDSNSEKEQAYQNLMNTKVALEKEVNAYRKVLGGGQSHLNITPNASVGSSSAKKRKSFQLDKTDDYECSDVIQSSATGDIEGQVCQPKVNERTSHSYS